MVIVTIDRDGCVSCASCWTTCPAFFEQNPEDSFSQVIGQFRVSGKAGTGRPPDNVAACTREAADLCPVQVITVEDE